MTRKRVVVAGLGDSGLLTAIRLTPHTDVVGISVKPSCQWPGARMRLTRPDYWAKDYRVASTATAGSTGPASSTAP